MHHARRTFSPPGELPSTTAPQADNSPPGELSCTTALAATAGYIFISCVGVYDSEISAGAGK